MVQETERKRLKFPRWRRPTWRQILVATLLLVGLGWLLWRRCGLSGCPNVEQLSAYLPGGASILYTVDEKQFARLAPIQYEVVSLESLPDYVPAAFVAVEDKRFYEHDGVDYRRVLGSIAANIKALGFAQGFSTITMQIAGNIWRDKVPRTKKTISRKILEIRLAREIERKFTKEEILGLYLNNIYFGSGSYGIEAAARNYFRRPASELTVAQAAMLAALPKSPTLYDPRRSPQRAKQRRDLVLSLMAEQGKIGEERAERATSERLNVRRDPPAKRGETGVAPYFVEAVRRVLEDKFGEDLYNTPMRIYTTLDMNAQRAAEEELSRQLREVEAGRFGRYRGKRYSPESEPEDETTYVQGAVVMLNARTGGVLAQVGGRDYRQSSFDRVTRAKRQAGSAFKPFVYAAALAEGYAPSQFILDDSVTMELPGGEIWKPQNYTGDFRGKMTMRNALVQSRNLPTIRLAHDVGLNDVARVARQSGIRSTIPELPSMPIGTAAVTPLELARSYTPFATLGYSAQPRWIVRVEDEEGNVIWEPDVRRDEVVEPGVAYLVTDMLGQAVDRGTGSGVRSAGFRSPAAGKTGTTNDGADVWFVGYTPRVVTAIWIGFDTPKPIVEDASGGTIAAPLWGRIMRELQRTRVLGNGWEQPESVIERRFDPSTGLLLAEGCEPQKGSASEELFLKYAQPAVTCPRGEPTDAPNVFDRAYAWVRARWHSAGQWLASHFGSERDRDDPRRPYLGVPKLPEAAEVSLPVMNPEIVDPDTILLGVPYEPEPGPIDTPIDTLTIDTVPPPDTIMPPDTIIPDTVWPRAS